MRLVLVAKPLVLILSLTICARHPCLAFHTSFDHARNQQMYLRTSAGLRQCMTWIPRDKIHQQRLFLLNESDKHGASASENSSTLQIFLRRLFTIIKYPGAVLKFLRNRSGIRKLNRTIDRLFCSTEENDASNSLIGTPILSPTLGAAAVKDRWAYSAPYVNLTGSWKLIVSDDFLKEYDVYLRRLGQPSIVRSIAMSIIDRTTEETLQTEGGRSLLLRSINARGVWERTLIGSGLSPTNETSIVYTTVLTADKEPVQAEAWWEKNGTVHRSWLRGVTKYGGGDFESARYLGDDDSILVCESAFHPQNGQRDSAHIQWRFRRRC